MYVIIDAERMKVVAKVRDYKCACILPDLEHPKVPTHALAIDGKRTFSKYTELELVMLARNGGLDPNLLSSYSELLRIVYDMVEAMDMDPRTYDQLDKKAGAKTLPSDDPRNAGKHKLPAPSPAPATPEPDPNRPKDAPKPQKAPSAPRTKGATGKVHEICDSILAGMLGAGENPTIGSKEFRSTCREACVKEGINEGTFGVQFGKWKSIKAEN